MVSNSKSKVYTIKGFFFFWVTYVNYVFFGQAPITWEDVDVTPIKGPDGNFNLPPRIFESMAETGIGLKGPLATPVGKGHKSLNLALRK